MPKKLCLLENSLEKGLVKLSLITRFVRLMANEDLGFSLHLNNNQQSHIVEIYVFFASKQLSAVTYSGNLR